MTTTLRIERDGPVARVWLDRPEVRNAMNGTLIRELAAAFGTLAGEDGVRAIVLGGSGKAFCAGADLAFMREAADYTWEQNHADAGVRAITGTGQLYIAHSISASAAASAWFCSQV